MGDRLRTVELRHLTALRAVARERSFRRAAARLGYTQSAVSQQIAALERTVGERLVERPGGRSPVVLTDAGELLVEHAEAIAGRLEAAAADLANVRRGGTGTLRIGADQSVGARILPDLLRRLSQLRPNVVVELVERVDDVELARALERDETDLAFVDLTLADGPFEAVEILRDPYVLVVSARSPLALAASPPALAGIGSTPLLCCKSPRCVDRLLAHVTLVGTTPNVVLRSGRNDTLQALAAAGLGIAFMPRLAVDERDNRTRVLDPVPPFPERVIGLAWHSERVQRPVAKAFVELARTMCAQVAHRNATPPGLGSAAGG
jgi:DNA-binding transcriptional LysR family regulator